MAIHFYVKGFFGLSPVPNKLTLPLLIVDSTNIEAKDFQAREHHVHQILQTSLQMSKKFILTLKLYIEY